MPIKSVSRYYANYLALLLFLIFTCPTEAQVISTIAGPGNKVYNCVDDGFDILNEITNPASVAADDSGDVFIAIYWDGSDLMGNVIKLRPNGRLNAVKGIGAKENSGSTSPFSNRLSYPHGIAADGEGNIYIAEYNRHVVRKITSAGRVAGFAGDGTVGYSGDKGPATAAKLSLPNGLALDRAGNLYIADEYNNVIRKVTPGGIISTYAGTGDEGYNGDGGRATRAQLNKPYGVATDSAGNVYFADSRNNVIRKVDGDGIISTIAGNGTAGYSGDGGPARAAQLNKPVGITADALGNIYIADEQNNAVRKVSSEGIISTIAGNGRKGYRGDGGPATSAELSLPRDVAVDGSGNVYIADFENHVIRKVTVPPVKVIPPPKIVTAQPREEIVPDKTPTPAPPHNDEDKVTISVDADDMLTIKSEKGTYTSFTIMNMEGEKKLEQEITTKELNVDVKKLPPGFYDISLKSSKGNKVLRFVKGN